MLDVPSLKIAGGVDSGIENHEKTIHDVGCTDQMSFAGAVLYNIIKD